MKPSSSFPPPSLSSCLAEIKDCLSANFLKLYSDKTEVLLVGTKSIPTKSDCFSVAVLKTQKTILPLQVIRVWVPSSIALYPLKLMLITSHVLHTFIYVILIVFVPLSQWIALQSLFMHWLLNVMITVKLYSLVSLPNSFINFNWFRTGSF